MGDRYQALRTLITGEKTTEKSPQLANLMPPWPPGVSGNPHPAPGPGRPKGASLVNLARKFYTENPDKLNEVLQGFHKVCKNGNTKAVAELKEWIDGKAVVPTVQLDPNDLNVDFSFKVKEPAPTSPTDSTTVPPSDSTTASQVGVTIVGN